MKVILIKFVFIIALGYPELDNSSYHHTANSSDINLESLHKIESLIRKKAGAELEKNHENSFVLNGYNVYTEVISRKYGPSIYEEAFYEIQNPNILCRMRLVKNEYGEYELAVMIQGNEGVENYHACFDTNGKMLEEDPWGREEGYTIKTFNLYEKYRKIYSQRVDAK